MCTARTTLHASNAHTRHLQSGLTLLVCPLQAEAQAPKLGPDGKPLAPGAEAVEGGPWAGPGRVPIAKAVENVTRDMDDVKDKLKEVGPRGLYGVSIVMRAAAVSAASPAAANTTADCAQQCDCRRGPFAVRYA